MVQFSSTRTFGELQTEVKREFGDESGVQLTDADLIRWTNAGLTEVQTKNRITREVATTNLIKGQYAYTFPLSNVIEVDSIHVNGIPLAPISFTDAEEQILKNDPNREGVGSPRVWYSYGNEVYFWPTPEANSTGSVKIFYIPVLSKVSGPGDVLPIPDKYYGILLQYVMAKAYSMDENFDAATLTRQGMMNDMAEFADDETKAFQKTYPKMNFVEE